MKLRFLLIALSVNIAFGNMCTMAFAAAPAPVPMTAAAMPMTMAHACSHPMPRTNILPHADCDGGSCFLENGTEVRGISVSDFSAPIVALPTETSALLVVQPLLNTPYEPDMNRPPPDPGRSTVLLQ